MASDLAGNYIPCKTQYYVNDGFGRDTYIFNSNGGFCPEKQAAKIHEVGKYQLIIKLSCRILCYLEAVAQLRTCPHSFQTYCLHK